MDCLIINSSVNVGDYLSPNAECFKIISPASILVEGEVDEQDISKIKPGMKSVIAFDAYSNKKYEAEVFRLIPKTDETTKTSKVLLKLKQKPDNLNVGMTSTVNIIVDEKAEVLVIPKSANITKDKENYIYTEENNTLKLIKIDCGDSDGKYVELKGTTVKEGDIYAKEPKSSYKEGMKINPILK